MTIGDARLHVLQFINNKYDYLCYCSNENISAGSDTLPLFTAFVLSDMCAEDIAWFFDKQGNFIKAINGQGYIVSQEFLPYSKKIYNNWTLNGFVDNDLNPLVSGLVIENGLVTGVERKEFVGRIENNVKLRNFITA